MITPSNGPRGMWAEFRTTRTPRNPVASGLRQVSRASVHPAAARSAVAEAGLTPVPVSETLNVLELPPASFCTCRVATLAPTLVGANRTLMVQVLPAVIGAWVQV